MLLLAVHYIKTFKLSHCEYYYKTLNVSNQIRIITNRSNLSIRSSYIRTKIRTHITANTEIIRYHYARAKRR